jgi:hypothetical protein
MTITITEPSETQAVADFESVRSRLLWIAQQKLNRAADAEDVVQEVWIRWQGVDRTRVRDPIAFLVTITTRIALNVATSPAPVGRSAPARTCRIWTWHPSIRRGRPGTARRSR